LEEYEHWALGILHTGDPLTIVYYDSIESALQCDEFNVNIDFEKIHE